MIAGFAIKLFCIVSIRSSFEPTEVRYFLSPSPFVDAFHSCLVTFFFRIDEGQRQGRTRRASGRRDPARSNSS
ncbi:hypothetical protein Zmor_004924 [Zophobas morio]|uniref:Uncharacterized protein n=1 Tax=Zophobas morio TaxID=2755281 RepID=A0AA38IUB5_9CUCU|nr:hypothetical protein Zmor_004924 [Zophobas morio]